MVWWISLLTVNGCKSFEIEKSLLDQQVCSGI